MYLNDVVRCFIAINPGKKIRTEISDWIQSLKNKAPGLKWVKNEALHITLKFCGEIELKDLIRLQSFLDQFFGVNTMSSFSLTLGKASAFPSLKRPRTLWIGVEEGQDHLISLASCMEDICRKSGLYTDKRIFHPHITVARVKDSIDLASSMWYDFEQHKFTHLKWEAKEVQLIQSNLTPDGPIYTTLRSYGLSR